MQKGEDIVHAISNGGYSMRETVRSLSAVGVGNLKGAFPSTRGPGMIDLWCSSRAARCVSWVAMSRKDKH